MTDAERLAGYVEVWWQAVGDFTKLLEHVADRPVVDARPTCPAGTSRPCAAHTAHLEALLAGRPTRRSRSASRRTCAGLMGRSTPSRACVARRDAAPDDLINEIRESTHRAAHRAAGRPADRRLGARARALFGGDRLDAGAAAAQPAARRVDARAGRTPRGRPAGRPRLARRPAHRRLPRSRASASSSASGPAHRPGTTVVLEVAGSRRWPFAVDEDGPRSCGSPTSATASRPSGWRMDRETFIVLAGGRASRSRRRRDVTGDAELGERVLASLGVTP